MAILIPHYCFWFVQTVLECKEFSSSMCFTVQLSRFFAVSHRISFIILPNRFLFVKNFFSFFKLFCQFLAPRLKQLCHITMSFLSCQELFSKFFEAVRRLLISLVLQERSVPRFPQTRVLYITRKVYVRQWVILQNLKLFLLGLAKPQVKI